MTRVVVIGAGFGGLGAAAALRRAGIEDVTVLERADSVGGVWRDNTYPGAACDVPSPLYSWSWAPHPGWRRRYSEQPDILAYLRGAAEAEGLLDLVRTSAEVTSVTLDEAARLWRVTIADGTTYDADLVVSAVGQLSNPVVPSIPGLDSFEGPAFHSARWRHDVDLTGKRVAVIGTGASAIQFVPAIADRVGSMTVFQRSAPYVVPKPDVLYGARRRQLFKRAPATLRAERQAIFLFTERINAALGGRSWTSRPVLAGIRASWRIHLRRQVSDPALRAKLVPDYPVGCKRLLFSNEWYPALDKPQVDVVTEAVTGVEPTGVRTGDGRLHEADVIIWGTGFSATAFLAGIDVTGTGGADLHETWSAGATAHLGLTVPGFPNLFLVYGPHTNLGGSSIIKMMEAQAGYVAQVARRIDAGEIKSVDVDTEAAASFQREMDDRLAVSSWSGCSSWYEDQGRITTNWPGLVAEYEKRTATVDWDDLNLSPSPSTSTR